MGTSEPQPLWDESKQIPDEEIRTSAISPKTEEWEWKYARWMSDPEAMVEGNSATPTMQNGVSAIDRKLARSDETKDALNAGFARGSWNGRLL